MKKLPERTRNSCGEAAAAGNKGHDGCRKFNHSVRAVCAVARDGSSTGRVRFCFALDIIVGRFGVLKIAGVSAAQRTVISRQLPTTEPAQPCNEIDGCLLLMTGRTMVQNRRWRFGLSFTAAARSACSANLPTLPTSQSRLR
jgi:hypothetical protein